MALHFLVRHTGYAGMSTDSPEVITTTVGVSFYRGFLRRQENRL